MSQIADRIKKNLSERAEDYIVFQGHEKVTGGSLLEQVDAFEQEFLSHKELDCVAINLDTSPIALACFIASLAVAKNTAFIDTNWPNRDRENTLDSIGANLIVENNIGVPAKPFGQQVLVSVREEQSSPFIENQQQAGPKYTSFTSGTTGAPKGCVRSESSWIASFAADQGFAKIGLENTVVVLGSFAHSLGIYAAIRGLYGGAKVVLFQKFDASKIALQIQSTSDAIIFGVPTQFVSLARATGQPIKSAKRLLSTGAKLPQSHINLIQTTFPNAEIIEFYGTSELSYVSARKVVANDAPNSVGTLLSGVEIAIKETSEIEAMNTKIGLIQVLSQLAFDGYIVDGKFSPAKNWISVGDTGFIGEGGTLHLVGRVDRMFQSSGRNIVPEAIEAALLSAAGIKNAAAFGMPDATRENRIVCVIDANEELTRKTLVRDLKTQIISYTIPHKFYLCKEWPKTTAGKTDLRWLKEQILTATLDEMS